MMNHYSRLMADQTLSETAVSRFEASLKTQKTSHRRPLRLCLAACFLLLVPLTVAAVAGGFGQPKSQPMTNPPRAGKGYVTSVDAAYPRAVTDFSPELQTLNAAVEREFDSWQAAEDYIGFTLLDAPVLFADDVHRARIQVGTGSNRRRVHCVTSFVGDGQLYFGCANAHYQKDHFFIDLRATVAVDHPEMTDEMMEHIHKGGAFYPGTQVEVISSENITTQAGLPVCITTVEKNRGASNDYDATFFINGVSFRLRVSGQGLSQNEEAKALLLEILESIRVE